MNSILPRTNIADKDILRMEREHIYRMLRYVETFPEATTDPGRRGDYTFNTAGTVLAFHTGIKWQSISLQDGIAGGGGNPFDQDLNTTDSVEFDSLTLTNGITVGGDITLTGDALFGDGTAAEPSITFAADTDLGIYRVGDDAMGFSVGGTQRGQIGGSLNITIGGLVSRTYNNVFDTSHTYTGTGADVTGFSTVATWSPTTNDANYLFGLYSHAVYDSTNSIGRAYALNSWVDILDDGEIGTIIGANVGVAVDAGVSCSITGSYYGALINSDGTGDISIDGYAFQMYLVDYSSRVTIGAGKSYGIYQNGSGLINYFEGSLTVGGGLTITGDVWFGDGTAADPSISFSSDKDTGFYRVGADSIGVSTGATQRAQFDSTSFTLFGDNGIDITASGDVDVDLLTLGVTGTPIFGWRETPDKFYFSKAFYVPDGGGNVMIGTNDAVSYPHLLNVVAEDGVCSSKYVAEFVNKEASKGACYGVNIIAGRGSSAETVLGVQHYGGTRPFLVDGAGISTFGRYWNGSALGDTFVVFYDSSNGWRIRADGGSNWYLQNMAAGSPTNIIHCTPTGANFPLLTIASSTADPILYINYNNTDDAGDPQTMLQENGTTIFAQGIDTANGNRYVLTPTAAGVGGQVHFNMDTSGFTGLGVAADGTYELHINGDLKVYNNTGDALSVIQAYADAPNSPRFQMIKDSSSVNGVTFGMDGGDEDAFFTNTENADLRIGTNNVANIIFKASGNVGIGPEFGASVPNGNLHLRTDTLNTGVQFRMTTQGTGHFGADGFLFGINGTDNTAFFINYETGDILFDARDGYCWLPGDDRYLSFGASKDVGTWFDGTDWIFDYDLLDAGTTGYRIQQNGTDRAAVMSDGTVRLGDTATNYSQFATDGEQTMAGTARVYKTVWISASAIRAAGVKAATVGLNGGGYLVASFADNQEQQIQYNLPIPEDMDRSADCTLRVGWSSPTTSQDCDWEITWLATAEDDDTEAAGTTDTGFYESSGTADGLVVSSLETIAGGTLGASDVCLHIVLERDGNDAGDTLGAVAEVHGVCLRYVSNKHGTAL